MISNSVHHFLSDNPLGEGREKIKNIGARICQATSTVYLSARVVHHVCKETVNSPGRVATMLTAGAVGLNSLWNGDIFTGGVCATAAYCEAKNVFGTKNNKSEVARLINDARSGIEMIETLEEENKKSFEIIDFNLDLVSQNMTQLTTQLNDIQALASQNCEELEVQKNIAAQLHHEANELFTQAQAKLKQSHASISKAHLHFKWVTEDLGNLVESVESMEDNLVEELETFVKSTKKIHKRCVKASNTLEEANPLLNEGMELLKQALAKKDQASLESGNAIQMVKNYAEKIKEKASVEKDYQKEITLIRNETAQIKERNAEIEEILSEAAANLEEAQKLEEETWGTASIIIGGGIGALIGAAALGTPGTFLGIGAGGKAYHERAKISEYIMGADPVPVPATPTSKNPVTFEFNANSTGFWGRYVCKRQSHTAGRVTIQLGNGETVSYPFNLNDTKRTRSPICQKDLVDLGKRLKEQLKEGQISSEFCQQILNSLEEIQIDRGNRHSSTKGFLRKDTPSSNFLWGIAKRIKPEATA